MNAKNVTVPREQSEIIANWVPYHFKFGSWEYCFYCGGTPTSQDHVIPWSFLSSIVRDGTPGDFHGPKTPACHECNSVLSDYYFESMSLRCEYLNGRLRRRHSKLLHLETWQPWELKEIHGKLRDYVVGKQCERNIAVARVCWQFTETFTKLFTEAFIDAAEQFPGNEGFLQFMKPHWHVPLPSTKPAGGC